MSINYKWDKSIIITHYLNYKQELLNIQPSLC